MKRFMLAALLLTPLPALAQTQTSVPMQVTNNDLMLISTAVRIAATQCGSANPTGCQIGLGEAALVAKLVEADKALKAAVAAAADKPKK